MYGYIYLTTNKINGKQYVGQKRSDTFVKSYKGSGKALLKAISKYGFDNFECHIIDTAESQEELNVKEFVYVELYQTLETGYNLCEGGGSVSGYKHTEDTKRKMCEARAGEKAPFYGKHHTEETKQKLSEATTGVKNPRAKKRIYNSIEFGYIKEAYDYAVKYDGYDKSYRTFYRLFKD